MRGVLRDSPIQSVLLQLPQAKAVRAVRGRAAGTEARGVAGEEPRDVASFAGVQEIRPEARTRALARFRSRRSDGGRPAAGVRRLTRRGRPTQPERERDGRPDAISSARLN